MPTMPTSIITPKMPNPPAKLRMPVTYIAMMKPTTPTTSVIGSTMPHTLRGGGMGAAIGGSTAILPPAVAGGRTGSPGRTKG